MHLVDPKTQAHAAWMEHQILEHVKQALRVTVGWKVPAVGVARKLSSVQFTLKSFQRHLERLMNLEEQDGYMVMVGEIKPNMQFRVDRLEREHDQFRLEIDDLFPRFDEISEFDPEAMDRLCDDIDTLLDQIDRHDKEETNLLQESLLVDEGGEG